MDAAETEQDTCPLEALPRALMGHILVMLPPDSKARAACVRRGWRAVLDDPALWTRLDMTHVRLAGGVTHREPCHPCHALRAAAARAHGRLAYLDVSSFTLGHESVLMDVLAANSGSLRHLRVPGVKVYGMADVSCITRTSVKSLEEILVAAPQLHIVEPARSVFSQWDKAPLLMHAAPPVAPLRLRGLQVAFRALRLGLSRLELGGPDPEFGGLERVAPFAAVLADASLQPTLTELMIYGADTKLPEVMDALVDAVLARRQLRSLKLYDCTLPASMPLARLLRGCSLTTLQLWPDFEAEAPTLDAAGEALVADALRANTTLTSLEVRGARLFHDEGAASTLVGALVAHPSLRTLTLECEGGAEPAARGAALAALVLADTLQSLKVRRPFDYDHKRPLGDAGLRPLIRALPGNRHLRTLDISCNGMSEQFVQDELLPAVRANTSLREIYIRDEWPTPQYVLALENLVKSRAEDEQVA